jgi:hypothetical protein
MKIDPIMKKSKSAALHSEASTNFVTPSEKKYSQSIAMSQAEASCNSSPIRTRMFWTWDHSVEWVLNRPGAQTTGASNPYCRSTDVFVQDYTNLLCWCGRHGIDAVVVWGLLRDSHGGLETAKRLCEVAVQQGVRLLCGAGLNAYGGVYYEGKSPYSLKRHLEDHPDLYAVDASGNKVAYPYPYACPSRRENQEFVVESLQWLLKNLPLGGVQIETGDFGVCRCRKCKERRRYPSSQFSWEDMALMYPLAAKAIRSVAPEAWIVCETYSHPTLYTGPNPAPDFGEGRPVWADECLAKFPNDVFVTWVCDQFVKPRAALPWTKIGAISGGGRRNMMRAHFSTYWLGRLRNEVSIDWIADMVQHSIASGFDSTALFGEVSPFHTGAELNYLALAHYGSAANPQASPEVFLREVAAPLLGGPARARDYLRYARLAYQRDRIPAALKRIHRFCATLPSAAARRWLWLAGYLASFAYPDRPFWQSKFIFNWRISRLMPKEKGLDSVKAVTLKHRLGWKPIRADESIELNGFVNAHSIVGQADGLVYLAAELEVKQAGRWVLAVGHDGGVKVFLNGKAVLTEPKRINPATPDRSRTEIRLTKGRHDMLVVLDTDHGLGWGIFVRFEQCPEDCRLEREPERGEDARFPVEICARRSGVKTEVCLA